MSLCLYDTCRSRCVYACVVMSMSMLVVLSIPYRYPDSVFPRQRARRLSLVLEDLHVVDLPDYNDTLASTPTVHHQE